MIPYFATAGVEIFHGDCRDVLRALPAASVQMCVTSPPYFGLRDYGTGTWDGGDPACDHSPVSGRQGQTGQRADRTFTGSKPQGVSCSRCGAERVDRQIGLEPTPAEYVATMVEVFGEVRRVLRDDGTVWLNIGDSYAGGKVGRADGERNDVDGFTGGQKFKGEPFRQRDVPDGLKSKDLIGIPWSVAFALRDDGWYLRSDIIWHKPNPMPESVTDRPTKAHEYLFLLAKNERYYYDADAIAEPLSDASIERLSQDVESQAGSWRVPGKTNGPMKAVARNIEGDMSERGVTRTTEGLNLKSAIEKLRADGKRNRRSVWTVTTQPFSGAHFATFPPDLIEPCILAGSKPGDAVLDPFNGSGTTGEVCQKWGRRYVGIELNASYIDMSAERFRQHMLFSPEVA